MQTGFSTDQAIGLDQLSKTLATGLLDSFQSVRVNDSLEPGYTLLKAK